MSLKYIFGIPGSGKTYLCTDEVINCARSGKKALYIVPEQFSLESERLITEKSDVLMSSEVVSFVHLAHRMLSHIGKGSVKILDDDSKLLLLRKAAIELKANMLVYKSSADKQGFLENISALISELVCCGVTPDILLKKSEHFSENNVLLSRKLKDIASLYSLFMTFIHDKYILKDTLPDILAQHIPDSGLFDNTEIWIDSFTDFTPQEIKVIGAFLKVCPRVTISIALPDGHIPASPSPFNPLFELWRSVKAISATARDQDIAIEKPLILTKDVRHKNAPNLKAFTEEYLKGKPICCSTGNDIKTFSSSSIDEELEWCAQEIISLLTDNSLNCSDIGVIVSSDSYYLPLNNIFAKYNIPFFTDVRHDILSHPLTVFICSVFRLLTMGWRREDFFALLHSGLTEIEENEICLAENYCIATGIRRIPPTKEGTDEKEWEFRPGYESDADLEALNLTRRRILSIASAISLLKGKHTVNETSKGIYSLLNELGVEERLSAWIDCAKQKGDENAARINTGVWNAVGTVFSRMCSVMGEDKISTDEFFKLLYSCIKNATLGVIPPTCDGVTVGEFNRSRLPNIKVLFMLGVNEGLIPPHHNDTNLLSDNDRALLSENDCILGGDTLRLITRDSYKVYACVSKPSKKLYISCNTEVAEGIMSSFMQDIINNFSLTLMPAVRDEKVSSVFTDEQAYSMLLKHIKSLGSQEKPSLSPFYLSVYNHLKEKEEFSLRLKELRLWSDIVIKSEDNIEEELAKELYLKDENTIKTGITNIEAFERCPFGFFLKNGLLAFDRNEFSMENRDYGTLFHKILSDFSDTAMNLNMSWAELKENGRLNPMVEAAVQKAVDDCKFGFFSATEANKYIVKKIKQTACDVINAMAVNNAGLVPYGYEIPFGKGGKSLPPLEYRLNDNVRLLLKGSIDRADIVTDEKGSRYVRITDYKNSASTAFSADDVFIGIKLQLPLYMQAFLNGNDDIKPGAFFYFGVNDPVFDAKKSARDLDGDTFRRLIAGGVSTNEKGFRDTLNYIEREKFEKASADNNRDKINRSFFTISENQFNALYDCINGIISKAGTDIIKGVIKPYPYKCGKNTACGGRNFSCEYSAICGFELRKGGMNKYRTVSRKKLDDARKILMDIEEEKNT